MRECAVSPPAGAEMAEARALVEEVSPGLLARPRANGSLTSLLLMRANCQVIRHIAHCPSRCHHGIVC